MKEIVFWFSNYKIKNYWFEYTVTYCKKKFDDNILKYCRIKDEIKIGELKIKFKVDKGPNSTEHIGIRDINQYWVENLFDNNFKEFFMSIVKEEIKDGEEGRN